MSTSIGVVATFRDEVNAMPGFLEMASRFFDEIFLADCSIDMTPSGDGSLDIIRKWSLPDPPLWNLSEGFGAVRSQLLRSIKTDWAVIMDIDERMQTIAEVMNCKGEDVFPAVQQPNLTVVNEGVYYNQREILNVKVEEAEKQKIASIRFARRHWFDMTYKRPTQNWTIIRDYQLRCMKTGGVVGFRPFPKMHEQAVDYRTNRSPLYIPDDPFMGPYLDHHHCWYKPMEKEQRASDIAAYDSLHKSETHTPMSR